MRWLPLKLIFLIFGSLAACSTGATCGGACVCKGGTFITAGVAERIGNCTQLSLGLGVGLGGGVAANALAIGWGVGVAAGGGLAVVVSEGVGAGVRGRGGKRVQLSMSVTGPWAKLGTDKLAEMAKASAVLAP